MVDLLKNLSYQQPPNNKTCDHVPSLKRHRQTIDATLMDQPTNPSRNVPMNKTRWHSSRILKKYNQGANTSSIWERIPPWDVKNHKTLEKEDM